MTVKLLVAAVVLVAVAVLACLPWSSWSGSRRHDERPQAAAKARFESEDVSRAALKLIYPLPRCSQSWIGGTVEQCDAAQRLLNEKRAEYATLEPAWMREAILHWYDYAQREISENREDCLTQKSRKDLDAYKEKTRLEIERARDLLRSIGR